MWNGMIRHSREEWNGWLYPWGIRWKESTRDRGFDSFGHFLGDHDHPRALVEEEYHKISSRLRPGLLRVWPQFQPCSDPLEEVFGVKDRKQWKRRIHREFLTCNPPYILSLSLQFLWTGIHKNSSPGGLSNPLPLPPPPPLLLFQQEKSTRRSHQRLPLRCLFRKLLR